MSEDARQQERIEERAVLLPEEVAAGSDDPQAQAEAILAESDQRVEHPAEAGETSTQTTSSSPP